MKLGLANYGQALILLTAVSIVASVFLLDLSVKDAVPLLAALIAGFVALSINETVASRKKAEVAATLRGQRQQVYQDLLSHMLQSFQGGPQRSEWEVRAQIAVWGSPELLREYSNWRRHVNRIIGRSGSSQVPPHEKPALQESIARVCLAARQDLEIPVGGEPTTSEIAHVFFDDY